MLSIRWRKPVLEWFIYKAFDDDLHKTQTLKEVEPMKGKDTKTHLKITISKVLILRGLKVLELEVVN